MTELERELRELGRALEYPATPDVAAAVRRRLEERPARRSFALRARPVAIALAMLAAALAAALAVPQARTAILELLGLRGVEIRRVDELPAVRATAPLHLGRRVTLAQASRAVGRTILVPRLDGLEPDAVYVEPALPGEPVSLVYGRLERPRLLLTQFAGELLVGKLLGPETRAEPVTVDGGRGIWLEGAAHTFFFRDENGVGVAESQRLAGNTLLWERGELTLRLEGDLSRAEALRIARAVR